ncbi:MAG TPA: hypothetical protein VD996_14475 [Chitinophagaceae bacterium]|nr:hypothetical protein [Chitinophagaceae bacterium]
MKIIITLIFLIPASSLLAQEKLILKLLNQELKREVQYLQKNPGFVGDTLIILQPFTITENKMLSVVVKKAMGSGQGYQIIKQEAPLNKIESILKDINVILVTTDKDVAVTTTDVYHNNTTKTQEYNSDLFFLHLSSGQQNERWQDKMIGAFSKAGVTLQKEIWAD